MGGFPVGLGGNSTTGKLHSHFSRGEILVAENHSRFSGGKGRKMGILQVLVDL